MTKARLRFVVILCAIGMLGGLGFVLVRVVSQQAQSELVARGLELLPEVAQRIEDFHRVQVRDGRKEWEIAAREARYFEEEQRVVVREPLLRVYLNDGRSVGVKGEEGTVALDGKELESVEVSGAIEVNLVDYTVRADYARYDRDRDLISAPGRVSIDGKGILAEGTGLEVEVAKQTLRLEHDVEMTFRSTAAAGEARDGTP